MRFSCRSYQNYLAMLQLHTNASIHHAQRKGRHRRRANGVRGRKVEVPEVSHTPLPPPTKQKQGRPAPHRRFQHAVGESAASSAPKSRGEPALTPRPPALRVKRFEAPARPSALDVPPVAQVAAVAQRKNRKYGHRKSRGQPQPPSCVRGERMGLEVRQAKYLAQAV